jgi:uncharacterized membrane protein YphA (DoxX/SURF4 family)
MSDAAGIIFLIGRILFVTLFLVSAFGHITKSEFMVGYARSKKMPLPMVGGWPAGVYQLIAAALIAVGIWPDIGAIMLGIYVTIAAFYFHDYWKVEDAMMRQTEMLNFFRNVTLLGAAVMLFALAASAGDGMRYTVIAPLIRF